MATPTIPSSSNALFPFDLVRPELEKIEIAVHVAFHNTNVITHIEPNDDPLSFEDIQLHRSAPQ
jgi:hypothetical protein